MILFEIFHKEGADRGKAVVLGRIRAVSAEAALDQAKEQFNIQGHRLLIAKMIEETKS